MAAAVVMAACCVAPSLLLLVANVLPILPAGLYAEFQLPHDTARLNDDPAQFSDTTRHRRRLLEEVLAPATRGKQPETNAEDRRKPAFTKGNWPFYQWLSLP
ncbi:hypothetical protein THASP1DRAFT_25738 [Thamnocephalis sphaerospora]|uniref:Uncharacterized protein n=1 Tax=Thamnocephalis sphaerospora TaxID=78915 RepID=A0A4P9XJ99_9FUNG|nr:hypothetical protein THASP1DRAFT_25738 [Thamnocephalis sphaerospora]|eukprot:RKP05833.1 hypothetical protein THASP1DRAFT_25738 [Thamnocephalis sphaerospora]